MAALTAADIIARLKHAVRVWKKREAEYTKACLTDATERIDRPRYEGIAIGTRWCREETEKIIEFLTHDRD